VLACQGALDAMSTVRSRFTELAVY
jgi:hypothetical protein